RPRNSPSGAVFFSDPESLSGYGANTSCGRLRRFVRASDRGAGVMRSCERLSRDLRRLRSGAAPSALLALPAAIGLGVLLAPAADAATTLGNSVNTVYLQNYGTGNPFTVNAGTVIDSTAGSGGDGISGDSSQSWTLTNSGSVSGVTHGVYLQSLSTVTNAGTISTSSGTAAAAVGLAAGGVVVNQGTIASY